MYMAVCVDSCVWRSSTEQESPTKETYILQKRPMMYMAVCVDSCVWRSSTEQQSPTKETYILQKRPIFCKRDL